MPLSPRTERICELYKKAVSCGEDGSDVVGYLAAMEGVQRPAIYKRLRQGGLLPPYPSDQRPRRYQPYIPRLERKVVHREMPPRVYRDPCPRCGARGDVECGHSKARLGMVL